MTPQVSGTAEHFWSKASKGDGCWLWIPEPRREYGRYHIRRVAFGAHVASWMITNGPIPDGLQVLHKCDVPRCVRPDHLFLGTQADNMADKVAKGRQARGERLGVNLYPECRSRGDKHSASILAGDVRRGERVFGAKLDEPRVREIRSRAAVGESYRSLARSFRVDPANIRQIVTRATWKHVP